MVVSLGKVMVNTLEEVSWACEYLWFLHLAHSVCTSIICINSGPGALQCLKTDILLINSTIPVHVG